MFLPVPKSVKTERKPMCGAEERQVVSVEPDPVGLFAAAAELCAYKVHFVARASGQLRLHPNYTAIVLSGNTELHAAEKQPSLQKKKKIECDDVCSVILRITVVATFWTVFSNKGEEEVRKGKMHLRGKTRYTLGDSE
ncbi:uncharacterized protein V6R79_015084 [Siganus canaliculatus]